MGFKGITFFQVRCEVSDFDLAGIDVPNFSIEDGPMNSVHPINWNHV